MSHISDFVIRETKKSSNLQLPEKIILFEYADWEDNQKRMYEELREQLKIIGMQQLIYQQQLRQKQQSQSQQNGRYFGAFW